MFAAIGNLIVGSGGFGSSSSGRDVLNAPVAADSSFSPAPAVDHFSATVNKYRDYLENPPIDYTTEQSRKILDWASNQKTRLSAALVAMGTGDEPDFDHDRFDDLSDKSCFVGLLIEKARSNIEGDESLNDEGSKFRA